MPRIASTGNVPQVPPTCDPANPCIVQSDRTILVEVNNPRYAAARDALSPFAELEKSPEHLHTYRISNLSLWNAAAVGLTSQQVIETLLRFTKFPLPPNLLVDIHETMARYGRIRLERLSESQAGLALRLVCDQPALLAELRRQKGLRDYLGAGLDERSCQVAAAHRGVVKQALIAIGYPAEDLAGYTAGADLPLALRDRTLEGRPFVVRDYQREAAAIFHAGGQARGGSGVIVLPCGAGKTIVGLTVMALLQKHTLILTTSTTAVKQWKRELLDKTTLTAEQIKEYTGESKEIGPVTIATYQILTYRPDRMEEFPHFGLFEQRDWGLIIYDEVHLLPAPVFRVTAQIQARRRLGLTATLVREDGREGDVFALIGPKRYDVPWRELETQGWIASAQCTEVRVCLPNDAARLEYAVAERRAQYRIASENPAKDEIVAALLSRHEQQQVLIIGQYLSQLRRLARRFQLPLITGSTPNSEREQLYTHFRKGQLRHLILSKVGNFAIDLPDANVLIQVSGTFGSRQEEAQRLGRILRPKSDGSTAHFYTIVTRDTCEQDFAHHRQLFLTEQGYSYEILDESDLVPFRRREAG